MRMYFLFTGYYCCRKRKSHMMNESQIRIVFDKSLFDGRNGDEKKATISSIFDAFLCMTGFLDYEIQLNISKTNYQENCKTISFYTDNEKDPAILFLTELPDEQTIHCVSDEREAKFQTSSMKIGQMNREWIKCIICSIFRKLKEIQTQYTDVINLFISERLWEIYALTQFCEENILIRNYICNRCQETIKASENIKTSEDHFLFLCIELKYLSLINREKGRDQQEDFQLCRELKYLSDNALKTYSKTNRPVFIKLAAMILGGLNNPDYAEKYYLNYLSILRGNRKALYREYAKVYYDVGKIYETYSDRGSFVLSSVYKAAGYFKESYEYDPHYYRALYKCILSPEKKEIRIEDIKMLIKLHSMLQELKCDIQATLRVYLYDYKVMNHICAYRIRKKWGTKVEQNQLTDLVLEYEKIMTVWDMMGLNDIKGSVEGLDKYLKTKIREILDLILTLREQGAEEEFQLKRNRLFKPEVFNPDKRTTAVVRA